MQSQKDRRQEDSFVAAPHSFEDQAEEQAKYDRAHHKRAWRLNVWALLASMLFCAAVISVVVGTALWRGRPDFWTTLLCSPFLSAFLYLVHCLRQLCACDSREGLHALEKVAAFAQESAIIDTYITKSLEADSKKVFGLLRSKDANRTKERTKHYSLEQAQDRERSSTLRSLTRSVLARGQSNMETEEQGTNAPDQELRKKEG